MGGELNEYRVGYDVGSVEGWAPNMLYGFGCESRVEVGWEGCGMRSVSTERGLDGTDAVCDLGG